MKSIMSSVEAPEKKCTLVCLLLLDSLGPIWFSIESPAIITSILPLALGRSCLDGLSFGCCFLLVGGLGASFSVLLSFGFPV